MLDSIVMYIKYLIFFMLFSFSCKSPNEYNSNIDKDKTVTYRCVCRYSDIEYQKEICSQSNMKKYQNEEGIANYFFSISGNRFSVYEKIQCEGCVLTSQDSVWGNLIKKRNSYILESETDFLIDSACVYNNGIRELEMHAINNPYRDFFGLELPYIAFVNGIPYFNLYENKDSSLIEKGKYSKINCFKSGLINSNDSMIPFERDERLHNVKDNTIISSCPEKLVLKVNSNFINYTGEAPDSAWFEGKYLHVRYARYVINKDSIKSIGVSRYRKFEKI